MDMGCLFYFASYVHILLNKMDVYFLLVSESMSINAKFPVMFIG